MASFRYSTKRNLFQFEFQEEVFHNLMYGICFEADNLTILSASPCNILPTIVSKDSYQRLTSSIRSSQYNYCVIKYLFTLLLLNLLRFFYIHLFRFHLIYLSINPASLLLSETSNQYVPFFSILRSIISPIYFFIYQFRVSDSSIHFRESTITFFFLESMLFWRKL